MESHPFLVIHEVRVPANITVLPQSQAPPPRPFPSFDATLTLTGAAEKMCSFRLVNLGRDIPLYGEDIQARLDIHW